MLGFTLTCFSQNSIEQELDAINSIDDAQNYIRNNKAFTSELITFNSEKQKTEPINTLFELSIGEKTAFKTEKGITYYKVISKDKIPHYRVSIIELSSKETSLSEINSLRSFILKGIRNGEHKFPNLARVYSSHPSGKTGGDLGWLKEGTRTKRFEKSVKDNRLGKVYTFDDYRDNLHYVIMKTSDNQDIEVITVLKVIEAN
jgi:parvulin-like peptidyl-prolyl isomerase